jgi:hypothetical protein
MNATFWAGVTETIGFASAFASTRLAYGKFLHKQTPSASI